MPFLVFAIDFILSQRQESHQERQEKTRKDRKIQKKLMETDQRHTKTRKSSPKIPCAQILVEIYMAESARECDPYAKLMSEAQVYYCLYNKYSKDFKDKYKKINCWQKVGNAVGLTPESDEKNFRGLRQ